jgi:hypothetical protein
VTALLDRVPGLGTAARRLRGRWRRVRVGRNLTRLVGTRHARSRTRIELDITWACNLRCANCNRSCTQAPTGEGMTLDQVRRFVDESIARGKRWERIRVLGGEPTLHPELDAILAELLRYRAHTGGVTLVEIATHGHGERVRAVLARLPPEVRVDDSGKTEVQPAFDAFNVAPADLPSYASADFRNGCAVTETCGIGLGPYGYYPCAVAAGIDRVVGLGLGRTALPLDADDLHAELAAFCRLCGHFRREHAAPVTEATRSPTWERAYARWRVARPRAPRY